MMLDIFDTPNLGFELTKKYLNLNLYPFSLTPIHDKQHSINALQTPKNDITHDQ